MKITFYREGHANNSSSSHSIVFTDTRLENSETSSFGWGNFICSSAQAKTNYLVACLYTSFQQYVALKASNNPYFDWAGIAAAVSAKLKEVVIRDVCPLLPAAEAEWVHQALDALGSVDVDHQSVFYFPSCRNPDEGLHVGFIVDVFLEITKPEYVILGGNDNDSDIHPDAPRDAKSTPFTEVLQHLKRGSSRSTHCVYDPLLQEYLISWDSGPIMKINFNALTPKHENKDRLLTIGDL